MKKTENVNIKRNLYAVICAFLTVILLGVVIGIMIRSVYVFSEEEAHEKMHLETQQIKRDLNLQMTSDIENLTTIANFASTLYENGDGYSLVFDSFEKIGLFERIGILLPDGHYITKNNSVYLGEKLPFDKEVEKGAYVSGRVTALTGEPREVVRSAVPIKTDKNETVAMLYGVIELETLKQRYVDDVQSLGANLYVVEGGNGKFIIDTKNKTLGNITRLAAYSFADGYSYNQLVSNLTNGKSGYSSFITPDSSKVLYSHYAPLDFADWQIMLVIPADVVFAGARATGSYMGTVSILIVVIMLAYVTFVFITERKFTRINSVASETRKCLLELNRDFGKLYEAFKKITTFAGARSTFLIDSYGDDYNYIDQSLEHKLLVDEDRKIFINRIFNYVSQRRIDFEADVYLTRITENAKFRREMPEFYEFILKHDIKNIHFATITNNSKTSVLGVINAANGEVHSLLKDIAICFTIAIHNNKHLAKTESMAVTDALTGVANRMAYKHDTRHMTDKEAQKLTCIFIDVNELNFFNNKYGHAAGDQMLVFVAETLMNQFHDSRVYRIGGDEFLVFVKDVPAEEITNRIERCNRLIESMKYHVSVGVMSNENGLSVEELVNEAEKKMYDEKAKYYQNKELSKITSMSDRNVSAIHTGIKEIDACLSVMSMRYIGVFSVSLKKDTAVEILAPTSYFNLAENNYVFSETMKQYIHDITKPEYQRQLLAVLQYDVLERQLVSGHLPKISYKKINGDMVTLTIYEVPESDSDDVQTLWIFEKEDN